mmetsp:Transcript_31232/g.52231  ORF Transcript_31232/g.52231 Transcript_31232/m.52231 type:complete len:277 (+) Transcript_31232:41-871(+)
MSPPGGQKWTISLWECGNLSDCMFACFCPCIAHAMARHYLDGSSKTFNFCCMSWHIERWMIRTAYGIDGSCGEDYCVPCCCVPCSVNQAYQTTKANRNIPNAGRDFNVGSWGVGASGGQGIRSFCYACWCTPCATATALNQGVGVPWLMGCLCGNCCMAHNVIRYHYRIQGKDCSEECFAPYCIYSWYSLFACIGSIVTCCICAGPLAALGITPLFMLQSRTLVETRNRRSGGPTGRYMAGFTGDVVPAGAPGAAIGMATGAVKPATVVPINDGKI